MRSLLLVALAAMAAAASAAVPFLECKGDCPAKARSCASVLPFKSSNDRKKVGVPLCAALHASNAVEAFGKAITTEEAGKLKGQMVNSLKHGTSPISATQKRVTGVVTSLRAASSYNNVQALEGTVKADTSGASYKFDAFGVRLMGDGINFQLAVGTKVYFIVGGGRAQDIARDGTPLAGLTIKFLNDGMQKLRETHYKALHSCAESYQMDRRVSKASKPSLPARYVPHCCPRWTQCGGAHRGQAAVRWDADDAWTKYAKRAEASAPVWAKMHRHLAALLHGYDSLPSSPVHEIETKFNALRPSEKTAAKGKVLLQDKAAALRRRDTILEVLLAVRKIALPDGAQHMVLPAASNALKVVPAKVTRAYQSVLASDSAYLKKLLPDDPAFKKTSQ